jgi:DNA-directed RNA polymerase subunit K
MAQKQQEKFTRYEVARIIGARALQVAMDAPPLLKMSEDELKSINFDCIKIAEKEFYAEVLPITINRPVPLKAKSKLVEVKEEQVSDEELIAKAEQEEKEIAESAEEIGLVNEAEQEEAEGAVTEESSPSEEA